MVDVHTDIQMNVSMTATARTRTNLALHHLFAACRFATRIGEIEQEYAAEPFGGFWEEILQNALGVATLTVASLESYANEMYFEGEVLRNSLSPAAARQLAAVIDKESLLRKYSIALAVRSGKQLEFGSGPTQNVDALIRLRNAVVHFRPEWFDEQDQHDKLSKFLKHRFTPSPYLSNEPIFPRAWASASFATWALRSTVEFMEHVYSEIGAPCPLARFKEKLSSLSNHAL